MKPPPYYFVDWIYFFFYHGRIFIGIRTSLSLAAMAVSATAVQARFLYLGVKTVASSELHDVSLRSLNIPHAMQCPQLAGSTCMCLSLCKLLKNGSLKNDTERMMKQGDSSMSGSINTRN